MLLRRWAVGVVGLVGVLAVAGGAWAKPGIVSTQTGEWYWGDIDNSAPNQVVVAGRGSIGAKGMTSLKGATIRLNRQTIRSATLFQTPREEYDTVMRRLPKDDVGGRLLVAQWAIENKHYDLARSALASVRQLEPNNVEAGRLTAEVNKVAGPDPATQPGVAVGPGATQPAAATQPVVASRAMPIRTVTPEEINRIRKIEWQAKDRTVRVKVSPELRKEFIASGALPREEASRLQMVDLALAILEYGTPAQRDQVMLLSDPQPLQEFNTRVHRVVQGGCIQCHAVGKVKPGNDFVMFPENTTEALYSNFILLQQYETKVKTPPINDEVQYAMIDRTRPEGSLLLQFSLPPKAAAVPHPEAPGYQGLAKGKTDVRYQEMATWIQSLAPLPPSYDIDLTAPPKKADKPADNKTPAAPVAPRPAAGAAAP